MTMEIEIINKSIGYVAEVTTMNKYEGQEPTAEPSPIILQPGESTEILVWADHYPVIKEIGEVQLEKAGPDDIPKDETDEARLYREKEIKIEDYAGGFMLADYSGKNEPALFCGKSMLWINQPIVQDPFATREEAVKAGLSS